ncbi:MAG TPA: hypothetical protein VK735_18390 [Pseudonocardia sp.]|uniref:hypothetical protein n=1 Tax=Pseudonocardia sp. TaxID=60912 RepID=UPI002C75E8D6|nr:hypothetical protein [Pseudonocardia sp.]HTF49415.1 hypothetical protein [Pseudonocardia sp.]
MSWDDGVPWAIGGGSAMPAEILRLLSWAALGGQEGVFASADLRVQALETPGTSIRAMPGSCSIGNRALNASKELYIGRLFSQDEVPINPTGAGAGRSDLVVVQVENPYISGEPWQIPEDPQNGPYIFTRVIQNVSPTVRAVKDLNLGISAITLCRLDIPASTGTIIPTYIKDLRTVVNPMTGAVQPPVDGGGDGDDGDPIVDCPGDDDDDDTDDPSNPLESTQTSYLPWPFTAAIDIPVPSWANYADVTVTVISARVQFDGGNFLGGLLRLIFGGIPQEEQPFACNSEGRQDIVWQKVNMPIPLAQRGTTVHWHLTCRMISGFGSGRLMSTRSTKIRFDIKFKQRPGTD